MRRLCLLCALGIALNVFDDRRSHITAVHLFDTKAWTCIYFEDEWSACGHIISTPAMLSPIALAALIAILRSSSVSLTIVPSPPLWRLERKVIRRDSGVSCWQSRVPPTTSTNVRTGRFFHKFLQQNVGAVVIRQVECLEYRRRCFLRLGEHHAVAVCRELALIITGVPPIFSSKSSISVELRLNTVFGIPASFGEHLHTA